MWRLVYVLLVCAVVLTWQAVRVSFGDSAPQTPGKPAPAAQHSVTLAPPLWTARQVPWPAAPQSQPVTIGIPRLGVQAPVYDRGLDARGVLTIAPGYAVTHFQDSAAPGTAGNYVAYGHDDIQGQIFRSLPQLRPGDDIDLYQGAHRFVYRVTTSRVVPPTAVEVLRPTAGPTMTLISCTPYMVDTSRIVVTARLIRTA